MKKVRKRQSPAIDVVTVLTQGMCLNYAQQRNTASAAKTFLNLEPIIHT